MDTRLHCPKPTHRGRPRRLREGPAPAAGAEDARWRRGRREGRQALLGAVLFALACLAVAILMPALTQARGDALRSMSEAVTFEAQDIGAEQMGYRSGSHDVAFCLDGSMRGPEGTTYQLTDERDPVAGYIVYHGFPNTTTICGQPLTETEAEVVTQLALWMHGGFLSREGVICETNEAEGYEAGMDWGPFAAQTAEAQRACVALLDEAQAFADGGARGPEATWVAIFAPTDGVARQRLLLARRSGAAALEKRSARPATSDGNASYDLSGATYTVYLNDACTVEAKTISGDVARIVCDAGGRGEVTGLAPGTYFVRETAAPRGYERDERVYTVGVEAGQTGLVAGGAVADEPMTATGAVVRKVDGAMVALGSELAQRGEGDATLAGALVRLCQYVGAEGDTGGAPARTWTLRSDATGSILFDEAHLAGGDEPYRDARGAMALPLGTYTLQEVGAPEGYELSDGEAHVIVVRQEGNSAVVERRGWGCDAAGWDFAGRGIADEPVRGGIAVRKVDAETGEGHALGGATLAGTVFEVTNESALPVVVAGHLYARGAAIPEARMVTDAEGRAATAEALLPYGTYRVSEVTPPRGYLPCRGERDRGSQVVEVRQAGVVHAQPQGSTQNQVRRGDISLKKKEEGSMRPLAGVAFRVTSATTGESHVLVCDENGMADTSASWVAHTAQTNGNDAPLSEGGAARAGLSAERGVWFSGRGEAGAGGAVRDDLGALPYDTYEVSELRCAANEGHELVSFEVCVTRDHVTLDLGTVSDAMLPRLETEAWGDGGAKSVDAREDARIVDTVYYANVTPGERYSLTATLRDRDTGEEIVDEQGAPVTGSATFVASERHGTCDVEVPLDARRLGERSVVVFETLSDAGGRELAVHGDLGNTDETIGVSPTMSTRADSGVDGETELPCAGAAHVRDAVDMAGLVPGSEYRLVATLVDATTAQVVETDAGPARAERAFVAAGETETQLMELDLPAPALTGKRLVVFERLLRGDEEVCSHEDLEAQEQTVRACRIATHATTDAAEGEGTPTEGPTRVRDTVDFENLVPGATYHLVAGLFDKGQGRMLADQDGREVTVDHEFTCGAASGSEVVEIPLDASLARGRTLVAFETLTRDGVVVAEHRDANDEGQTVSFPTIRTLAHDAGGESKHLVGIGGVAVVDEVNYEGLVPGRTYRLVGELHDRETGEVMEAPGGGKAVFEHEFTPTEESGEESAEFAVDAGKSAGRAAVAFETLYDGGEVVARHADLSDEAQTVWLASIGTEARDADGGDKEVEADLARVVDTVRYENLEPGVEYELEGALMERESGEPVRGRDGEPLRRRVAFTPSEASGETQVEFELEAGEASGQTLVAFERLTRDGDIVCVHEDLGDEAQSVRVTKAAGGSPLPQTAAGLGCALAMVAGVCLLASSRASARGARRCRRPTRGRRR